MENLAEDICSFVPTHVCGLVTLLGTAAPAFLTVQIQSQPGLSWVMSSHTVWLYGFFVSHIQLLTSLQRVFCGYRYAVWMSQICTHYSNMTLKANLKCLFQLGTLSLI